MVSATSACAPKLNSEEMQLVTLHTDYSDAGEQNRVETYVQQLPTFERVTLVFHSITYIATRTAAAAALGAVVGGAVGTLVEPGGGTVVGAGLGAAVAGLAEGIIAGFFSFRNITIRIVGSTYYQEWKIANLKKVFPLFEELMKSEAFIELVCPISMELPQVPVKSTVCNHIFEQAKIEEWLKKDESCPTCRATFKATDLVYDQDRVNLIITTAVAKISELVKQVDENSKKLQAALQAVVHDGQATSVQVFKQVLNKELDEALKAKLGEKDVTTIVTSLYKQFLTHATL